jgi:hypothetical protein
MGAQAAITTFLTHLITIIAKSTPLIPVNSFAGLLDDYFQLSIHLTHNLLLNSIYDTKGSNLNWLIAIY